MSQFTCFPDIENNKYKQKAILESVFELLEKSNSTKELQDKINDILKKEVENGTINLDDKEIAAIQDKIGSTLQSSFQCEAEDNFNSSNNLSPSELAKQIAGILCNLPKFDFSAFLIDINIDLSLVEELVKALLQILLDILLSFITELLAIVIDICELTLDIGFGKGIDAFLNFFENLGGKLLDLISDIFAAFGIDFTSGNFIGATDEDCSPAIATIRPASEFITAVSRSMSTKELCQLLQGSASQNTINKIREILNFEFSTLNNALDTDEKISDLFERLGKYIDPATCLSNPQSYENLCNFNDLEQTKRELYKARGLSEDQINEAIAADNQRLKDKIFKVTNLVNKIRNNPDSIFDDVSAGSVLCKNGKEGIFKLSDFQNIVAAVTTLSDSVYNRINDSYILDCQKTVESNVKFVTRRKFIRKLLDSYTTIDPETGREEVINDIVNPEYLVEVDANNRLFVVNLDTDIGKELQASQSYGIQIDTSKISGFPDDAAIADYSLIIERPNVNKQIYEKRKGLGDEIILGVVAEFKERVNPLAIRNEDTEDSYIEESLQQPYSLQYSYNSDFNIQGINYKNYKLEVATELNLKKPDTIPSFLTNNNILSINQATASLFDTRLIESASFKIGEGGSYRRLTSDELSSIRSDKTIFTGFYESEGPFREAVQDIKTAISNKLPSLVIDPNGRSTEEQVFYELTKDKFSNPYEVYSEFGTEFLNSLHNHIVSSTSNSDFVRFIDTYFIEGLLRVRRERNEFLDKFINDPCALTVDSMGETIDPASAALVNELVRLFIKNEVIKNVVKNLPFLYTFDPYELISKDDMFIEFILQSLKKIIKDLTVEGKDFLSVMDRSITTRFSDEYLSNDLSVKDPITNETYDFMESEFSLDFKYRYYIKKEFMNLLVSFRQAYKIVQGKDPSTFEDYLLSNAHEFSTVSSLPNGINLILYLLKEDGTKINLLSNPLDIFNINKVGMTLLLKNDTYSYETMMVETTYNGSSDSSKTSLFEQLKQTSEYKTLMEYCFNYSKYLSVNDINEVILLTKNSYESTKILLSTSITIRNLIFDLLASTNDQAVGPNECYTSSFQDINLGNLLDGEFLKELILRLILEAPVTIIKSIAERFDPNISITNQIRVLTQAAASAATGNQIPLPILPFVGGLWPVNWGGWGPPITQFGIPYIVIDSILFAIAISELKINKIKLYDFSIKDFDINTDFGLENPYAKAC